MASAARHRLSCAPHRGSAGATHTAFFLASSPRAATDKQLAVITAAVRGASGITTSVCLTPAALAAHPGPAAWCTPTALGAESIRLPVLAAVTLAQRLAKPLPPTSISDEGTFATGAAPAHQLGGRAQTNMPPPLDVEACHDRLRRAIARFAELARTHGATDPVAGPLLEVWAERLQHTAAEYPLPTHLESALFEPEWPPLAALPFVHRCPIHKTEPVTRPSPSPPPPIGADAPRSCWECISPTAAGQMLQHWQRLEEWHNKAAHGVAAPRPRARAWSSKCIVEPWRTPIEAGYVLDFRSGAAQWLHPRALARPPHH